MIRILLFVSVFMLPGPAQVLVAGGNSSQESVAKEISAVAEQAKSPRAFIESSLNAKIIRVERDPEALLRALLLTERKGAVTQHVLEVDVSPETDLREVRIVTPNANQMGFPPLVVMPRTLISPCWSRCKDKCGRGTDCLAGCMFDCIVD